MSKLSPLASVSATREVLEAHGLATKKALGQHFLINDGVVSRICDVAELSTEDAVLEVGPGIGTLTVALLQKAGCVVAVERDADLPAVLANTCAAYADRFALIQKDALQLTEAEVREALAGLGTASPAAVAEVERDAADVAYGLGNSPSDSAIVSDDRPSGEAALSAPAFPAKLVSNLPYAVAATIVLDFFQRFDALESATIMVQSEVADRMAAKPGSKDYGAYTVKLGLFVHPTARFRVSPGNFFPPPRVDSAVIRLDRYQPLDAEGAPLSRAAVEATCTMADAAFATRRKTILNSCKTYFSAQGESGVEALAKLPEILDAANIAPGIRGEALDTEAFVRLGIAHHRLLG